MIVFEGDRSAAELHADNSAVLYAEHGANSSRDTNCFRVGTERGRGWLFNEQGCREAAAFFFQLENELARRRLNQPRTVTVRDGDTLWDLAQYHLGDPTRWPDIFDLNRDAILAHSRGPDLIYRGTVLKIPSP